MKLASPAGIALCALLAVLAARPSPAQEAPSWSDVEALFAQRCVMCHSGEAPPLGLRLDSYEAALEGSANGPVLVPGDPGASELVRRIRGESEPRMPLGGEPLGAEEIAIVEAWVSAGLPGADEAAEAQPRAAPDAEAESPAIPGPDEPVTFAQVEPIFMQRCVMCHSDAAAQGPPEGLRLDSYDNIVRGGERVALLPGNADDSEIVRRIEGTARPRMPLNGPPWLSDEQIRLIRQWIDEGAADAQGNPASVPVGREVRIRGIVTGEWSIDGVEFRVDAGTRVDDRPAVGQPAEMRGVVEADGSIRATRLRDR
jgi:mono/diheme cytochrome c family protein